MLELQALERELERLAAVKQSEHVEGEWLEERLVDLRAGRDSYARAGRKARQEEASKELLKVREQLREVSARIEAVDLAIDTVERKRGRLAEVARASLLEVRAGVVGEDRDFVDRSLAEVDRIARGGDS